MAKISNTELGKLYAKNASTGGGTSKYRTLGAAYASSPVASRLQAERLAREEEKRIQDEHRKAEEQRKNVEEFNKRQEELASSGKFKQFGAWIKKQMGEADALPEVQGASPRYNSARAAQIAENAYMDENAGRIAWFVSELPGKAKKAVTEYKQKQDEYTKSLEDEGMSSLGAKYKASFESTKGVAKNIGELASGVAKLAVGLSPFSGFSSIRKLIGSVGGQKVEQYVDRNTPEYIKSIDGFVDDNGILNYHPRYENIAQQTGGEVAEIGSWFIPITRSGKSEKMLSSIPVFSKLLNVSPKLVKFGEQGAAKATGSFALEVGKDVVDVATLDAIRGMSAEDILDDVQMAGAGSFTIRLIGKPIGYIFNKAKEGKTVATIELSGFGKLSSDEVSTVKTMLKEGKTTDEIQVRLADERGFFEPSISDTPIRNAVSREWDDIIAKDAEKKKVYDEYIRPQLDDLKEPKTGEVVVYRSSGEKGTTVETDPVRALSKKVDENFKVEVVPESTLKSTGDDAMDAAGSRVIATGEAKQAKAVKSDDTETSIKDITAKEFDESISSDRGIYSPNERRELYDKFIKPQLDNLPEPKDGEVIVYRSGEMGDGSFVNTSPAEVFTYPVDKNFKVEIVKESQLTKTGTSAKDDIGYRLLEKETVTEKAAQPKKAKSVTAQKMNKILGTDFEEGYKVRGINRELETAADAISNDEKKAIRDAFTDGGDTVRQVALLAEMLGKSKGMSKELQSDIFMRIKALSTQTGQTMNIFKALTESNPHWAFMNRLIDLRLGNAMKNAKWYEFRGKIKANKRAEVFAKETEATKKSLRKAANESFKIKDAQDVLKSLMCDY